MAAANLISDGVGAANSNDITVTTTPLVVQLKDYAQDAFCVIKLKDDAGAYQEFAFLDASQPQKTLSGAGVYRVYRLARSGTCGVFSG